MFNSKLEGSSGAMLLQGGHHNFMIRGRPDQCVSVLLVCATLGVFRIFGFRLPPASCSLCYFELASPHDVIVDSFGENTTVGVP